MSQTDYLIDIIKHDFKKSRIYYTDIRSCDSYGKTQICISVSDYWAPGNICMYTNEKMIVDYMKLYGVCNISSGYSDTTYEVTIMSQEEIERKIHILKKVLEYGYNPQYKGCFTPLSLNNFNFVYKGRQKSSLDICEEIKYYESHLFPVAFPIINIPMPKNRKHYSKLGKTVTFGNNFLPCKL